jgi:hypothetical protein
LLASAVWSKPCRLDQQRRGAQLLSVEHSSIEPSPKKEQCHPGKHDQHNPHEKDPNTLAGAYVLHQAFIHESKIYEVCEWRSKDE